MMLTWFKKMQQAEGDEAYREKFQYLKIRG